jgi:hypothetical protein
MRENAFDLQSLAGNRRAFLFPFLIKGKRAKNHPMRF